MVEGKGFVPDAFILPAILARIGVQSAAERGKATAPGRPGPTASRRTDRGTWESRSTWDSGAGPIRV
jgi:hypothetical protein